MRKRKNLGTILHVLNILKEQTDEEHLITQKEIAKHLRQKGINARRYTIERNLETLKEFGYNIESVKGVGTYLKKDGMNASDVYVLIEALNRANFVLENEYINSIKEKLLNLLNKYELEELENKNMIL